MRWNTFGSLAALLCIPALCLSRGAKAETFTFTASGIGYSFSASGTLSGTVDPNDPSAFDITTGSGQVNGVPLSLVNPGTTAGNNIAVSYPDAEGTAYYNYDNVVYTAGTSLDLYGLLFSDNGDDTNFFFQNGSYGFTNDEGNTLTFPITFSLVDTTSATAVTPEPSSVLLLATGMLGTCCLLRRRLA